MPRRSLLFRRIFPSYRVSLFNSLTRRLSSHRNVIVEDYPLHKKPGKSVSLQVALPSDIGVFEQYFKTLYRPEPLAVAFECNHDEMFKTFFFPLVLRSLRFPYSIMVMDGEQMVGFILSTIEVFDEFHPPAPMDVTDYGEVVEYYLKYHGVKEKNLKDALGISLYASDVMANFVPKADRQVLGHGALGSLVKTYSGNGLRSAVIIESARQMASDRICTHFYCNPTAKETARVAPRIGLAEVWSLNFRDIKIDGKFAVKKRKAKAGLGAIAGNIGLVQDVAKNEYLMKKE